ncbi:MAG: alpha-isopropylmalate synthase regulatory domain-containing protein [Acidimicrobiales bacterium]
MSAISRRKDAYEHVDPDLVGNGTRFVVSEMAGKATVDLKAKEIGIDLDGPALTSVIDELKRLEHEGYHFEAADGSLELLMRRAAGWEHPYFELESYRVIVSEADDVRHDTEAIVKLKVGGERIMRIGEGNGPVNALDAAVRAIGSAYPQLARSTSPTSRCACSTRPRARGP